MIAFILAVTLAAGPGQGPATIDPGMTQAQVVAKLGEPFSLRSYEGHTYLLYKNGCERTCGMSDLVVLDSGKVVDAIFRSRARKYTGTSSSPRMISAADARRGPEKNEPPMKLAKPIPAKPIPAKPTPAKPTPAKPPAPKPSAAKPSAAAKPAVAEPTAAQPSPQPAARKPKAPAPRP